MKEKDQDIDETFKAAFQDFEASVPKFNWDSVDEQVDQELDAPFRKQLQSLKVTPKPQVWENVKVELPLHPGARRYFSWMTKVAAVLVIGMLLCILSDQSRQHIALQQESSTENPTTYLQNDPNVLLENTYSSQNMEYVFEVDETNTATGKLSQKNREKEEMKQLLRFILEADEDLVLLADEKILTQSLIPAKALQDKDATAYHNEEKDLEIHIPLIIVESDQEAAQLIRLYESSHAPVIRVD